MSDDEEFAEARKRLAGQRDYCLILGVSAVVNNEDGLGPIVQQSPVIEVWNRNAITFRNPAEARELGLHFLGRTMRQVLDYQYTWAVESTKLDKVRITGFSIQPAIRDENGDAEWDQFIEIGHTQLKDFMRAGWAYQP